ncbi:MAG: diaminopimelate epimerase [Desulfonatronovibrionaceae bacterium]
MHLFTGRSVVFYKMQGSGNDFILFDNRELCLPADKMSEWAKRLCPRAFAVGADGMIFLNPPSGPEVDYEWDFFNSDGSRAEMCGNGSRCAARLAYMLGLAEAEHVFGTDAGPVAAQVLDRDRVRVQLTAVKEVQTGIDLPALDGGERLSVYFTNTGVPHAVVISREVQSVDVYALGRRIRNHDYFAPAGANVNFVQSMDSGRILLRTYERGVEEETYACGTGAAAAVVVARNLGLCGEEVEVTTSGGERLGILLEEDRVFLSGPARLVFRGETEVERFGLARP